MLNDLLRRHDGVVTLAQARTIGMSKAAVHRRVRSGEWVRRGPGVYFVDDRPFSDAARIRAAVWSYGELATATGLTAAWWQQLTRFAPAVVEVTVPRDSNGRCHDGSRVRRRDLRSEDVVTEHDLRVTCLPLTAMEAATRRGGDAAIVDRALQRHTNLTQLWRAHLRNKGRYGAPAARRLLQTAGEGTRSEAERLMARLLRSADITGWKANQRIAGYEVDILFRHAKVAIEVDGFAFHINTDDFQRDRNKQNAIALAGYQILRFTWLDLVEYPDRVLNEVKRAISA